jgi:hypothetical protein
MHQRSKIVFTPLAGFCLYSLAQFRSRLALPRRFFAPGGCANRRHSGPLTGQKLFGITATLRLSSGLALRLCSGLAVAAVRTGRRRSLLFRQITFQKPRTNRQNDANDYHRGNWNEDRHSIILNSNVSRQFTEPGNRSGIIRYYDPDEDESDSRIIQPLSKFHVLMVM